MIIKSLRENNKSFDKDYRDTSNFLYRNNYICLQFPKSPRTKTVDDFHISRLTRILPDVTYQISL